MTSTSVVIELPRDINKLCRTCMKVAEDNEESFEHKIIVNNQLTELSKMLESVTALKIGVNDGLPQSMCSQCSEYLNIAYLYKNHSINIDKDLRALVSDPKSNLESATTENTENKLEVLNSGTEDVLVCHFCLSSFTSNYELSIHLVIHNKDRSLSDRFKDNRTETKPVVGHPEQDIVDQIIERKLYTVASVQDVPDFVLNNGIGEKISDLDSVHSNVGSDVDEVVFSCDNCGQFFQSDDDLTTHKCVMLDEVINEQPVFKCPMCSKSHPNAVSLSIHFLKHAFTLDISAEPCFCEACGQLFDAKALLEEHYQDNICVKESWMCLLCNLQFENETLLLIHNSTHEQPDVNDILGKIPCVLCDENFLTKDTLASHTLTHLMKKHVCKECLISFCTQQAYFQHLKLHPGYQYTCIICGHLSKTKPGLKRHVIGVHAKVPGYSCAICKKSFKTSSRLKTHSHIHEESKKFMCSYCGYATHKSGDLQIHLRSHTSERPYKCTFAHCNRKFKTSSHLHCHLRRHLNIRNFTCSICNASFGTQHGLKVHHMLHTGEKPHNCVVCGLNFRRKYHLKVHMNKHDSKAD